MEKTVLITGSSTGIGRATALCFHKKGWNVIATMRSPEKEKEFSRLQKILTVSLDVNRQDTIDQALEKGIKKFGKIDVIINNAGYGLTGPFEGTTEDQIKKQFETNVFGLMRVVRSTLPYFRENKSGKIINISSMGGRIVFPYYSVYHATKWAVEGFTESLRFEVEPLGIQVKLIEPGAIKTDFYERSRDSSLSTAPKNYQELAQLGFANMDKEGENGSLPEEVAAVVYKAANDHSSKIRYPIGKNAGVLLLLRRLLPDSFFARLVRMVVFRKV
jgi:NAD(P)-dependent dehydrogenase (short-subunit alcohol dehydrogenase family)